MKSRASTSLGAMSDSTSPPLAAPSITSNSSSALLSQEEDNTDTVNSQTPSRQSQSDADAVIPPTPASPTPKPSSPPPLLTPSSPTRTPVLPNDEVDSITAQLRAMFPSELISLRSMTATDLLRIKALDGELVSDVLAGEQGNAEGAVPLLLMLSGQSEAVTSPQVAAQLQARTPEQEQLVRLPILVCLLC